MASQQHQSAVHSVIGSVSSFGQLRSPANIYVAVPGPAGPTREMVEMHRRYVLARSHGSRTAAQQTRQAPVHQQLVVPQTNHKVPSWWNLKSALLAINGQQETRQSSPSQERPAPDDYRSGPVKRPGVAATTPQLPSMVVRPGGSLVEVAPDSTTAAPTPTIVQNLVPAAGETDGLSSCEEPNFDEWLVPGWDRTTEAAAKEPQDRTSVDDLFEGDIQDDGPFEGDIVEEDL